MKKYIVLAVCLGLLLVSSMAMAATNYKGITPGKGIKGTAHDLSLGNTLLNGKYGIDDNNTYANNPAGLNLDRICIWCHTPHFSLKQADIPLGAKVAYLPLWNHELTGQLNYTPYTNGTDEPGDTSHASKAEELKNQPGGVSILCLSCHDGSVAVNSYGKQPGGQGPGDPDSTGAANVFIEADYKIGEGGDLSNHHPIGFNYDVVEGSDNEIQKKSQLLAGTYTIAALLVNGQMECVTCHDVHNTKNTGEKFLWRSDYQSELCLACHLKADVKKALQ